MDVAFEMISIISEVRGQVEFPELDMRIGIHTGDVIGGIIGTDIIVIGIIVVTVVVVIVVGGRVASLSLAFVVVVAVRRLGQHDVRAHFDDQ